MIASLKKHTKIKLILGSVYNQSNNKTSLFPVWHQDRLISAELEPVIRHTEKS